MSVRTGRLSTTTNLHGRDLCFVVDADDVDADADVGASTFAAATLSSDTVFFFLLGVAGVSTLAL